jgi:hypothetical protein
MTALRAGESIQALAASGVWRTARGGAAGGPWYGRRGGRAGSRGAGRHEPGAAGGAAGGAASAGAPPCPARPPPRPRLPDGDGAHGGLVLVDPVDQRAAGLALISGRQEVGKEVVAPLGPHLGPGGRGRGGGGGRRWGGAGERASWRGAGGVEGEAGWCITRPRVAAAAGGAWQTGPGHLAALGPLSLDVGSKHGHGGAHGRDAGRKLGARRGVAGAARWEPGGGAVRASGARAGASANGALLTEEEKQARARPPLAALAPSPARPAARCKRPPAANARPRATHPPAMKVSMWSLPTGSWLTAAPGASAGLSAAASGSTLGILVLGWGRRGRGRRHRTGGGCAG